MTDRTSHHEQVSQETRVSTLVGDRFCANCNYNLTGQAVLREPHYQMLIVRCPECATVASVQEYPLLGKWSNRWAAVLSGLWMLILFTVWSGSGAAIFGISTGTSFIATEKYYSFVSDEYSAWKQSLPPSTAAAQGRNASFTQWWSQTDPDELFANAGGWFGAIEWNALWMWILISVVAFILGSFWATALVHQRLVGRLLWGITIILVACAFASTVLAAILTDTQVNWVSEVAERKIVTVFLPLSIAFSWIPLSIGLAVGRKLTRWLLCVLLPPRLRGPFSSLWLTDGKTPPLN